MIEFGKSLRRAREDKGYSPSQIAEMTHLKPSIVEGLEKEDFSAIAAPIYGRGFVKLYCEAVGLDAKPFVDEFMAIVNGEREVAIKERPSAAQPEAPAPAAQETIPPPPPPPPPPEPEPEPEPDLFSQEEPADPVAPVPPPPPPHAALPSSQTQTQTLSRYAAPVREEPAAADLPSAFNPRILVLIAGALAMIVVFVLCIRSLYRATTADTAPTEPAATEPAATTMPAASAKPQTPASGKDAAAAPRTPQKIPSLYID